MQESKSIFAGEILDDEDMELVVGGAVDMIDPRTVQMLPLKVNPDRSKTSFPFKPGDGSLPIEPLY